jgi:uncharacterized protein YdeI (YjbR/CyaY-like superfamily)
MIKKENTTLAPLDLLKALKKSPAVAKAWNELTPIAQRDFITWVQGAKQDETRSRRITRTCEMLAEGKRRPCCYAVVPMHFYKALDKNKQAKDAWKNVDSHARRDFTDWIDETSDKETRTKRIEKVCSLLIQGKTSLR